MLSIPHHTSQLLPLHCHNLFSDLPVDRLDIEKLVILLDFSKGDEDIDAVIYPPSYSLLFLFLDSVVL